MTVEQVRPGATVELLVDGVPIQRQAVATANSVDVPLAGYTLPPGGKVTASWELNGSRSDPSLIAEPVLPYPPAGFGAASFISPIHTCMDWIALGDVYPGATIEVFNGAVRVGGPYRSDDAVPKVGIDGAVDVGDRLIVRQTVEIPGGATVKSAEAASLPAEAWYPREAQPANPTVIGPINECAGGVTVGGVVPGCWLDLHRGGDVISYQPRSEVVSATLPAAAHAPDAYAASSHLRRCKRDSGVSAAVPVDPDAPLGAPRLDPDTLYCPAFVSVAVSNLKTGASLTFELRGAGGTLASWSSGGPDGADKDEDLRTVVYPLGDLSGLIPRNPPYPAIVLVEQLCARSVESNPCHVWQPVNESAAPYVDEAHECSSWVRTLNAWGSLVAVRSDDVDWPILSAPTVVPNSGWVRTNRALRSDEKIRVTIEAGCVPDGLRESPEAPVVGVDLTAPEVDEPIRPGHARSVFVRKATPGGRVHVFVNGKWRAGAWYLPDLTPVVEIPVGPLKPEDQVTAQQTLCGKFGRESSPPVLVKLGKMTLKPEPTAVTRGQTVALTIRAVDADYGFPMVADPIVGPTGVVGIIGTPFTFTVGAALTSPITFTVNREGYAPASVDVPIQAPAPPPQAQVTLKLSVTVGVQNQVVTKNAWTLNGGGQSFNRDAKPNATTSSLSIALPNPPGGSKVYYDLSGDATIEFVEAFTGAKVTQQVTRFLRVANTPSGYALQDTIPIEWNGAPITAEINIGRMADPNGIAVYYFWVDKTT